MTSGQLPRFQLVPILTFLACCAACSGTADPGPFQLTVFYPAESEGLGDRSFADMVFAGVVAASQNHDFHTADIFPGGTVPASSLFKEHMKESPDLEELVITGGFDYANLVQESNCDFGGRQLLHLDSLLPDCPDLRSVRFRTFAPSFQAGVAAMDVSQSGKAAVLAGAPGIPSVEEFIEGFVCGVVHAGGEVTEIRYIADCSQGFLMAEQAMECADQMYGDADVIFPVAGGSALGVFESAKQGAQRYAIGIDSDQWYLGPGVILGSVVKHLDFETSETLASFAAGTFQPGAVSLGLEENRTEFLANSKNSQFAPIASTSAAAREEALEAELLWEQEGESCAAPPVSYCTLCVD